jgi:hypothetical protein
MEELDPENSVPKEDIMLPAKNLKVSLLARVIWGSSTVNSKMKTLYSVSLLLIMKTPTSKLSRIYPVTTFMIF